MKNQDVSFTSLNIPRGIREGRAGHLPEGAKLIQGRIRESQGEMGEPDLESGSSRLSLAGTSNTLLLKPETPSKGGGPGSLLTACGAESFRLKSFALRNLFDDVGIWANSWEAGGAASMPGTQ